MALQAAALYATVSVAGAGQSVRDLGSVSSAVDSTHKKLTILGRSSQGVGKGIGQIAGGIVNIAKKAGIAALALAAGGVAAASSFQDAFAGVKKTVEGTPAQLDALYESLKNLSTRIPVSFQDLAGIATEAGALDVATADVDRFTEAVARTTAATVGLDTATTSEAFGKLGTIFKLHGKDYERLGSSLVDLGRNAASTEPDIIAVTQRFAAAGTAAGLSAADVLGWSSAIASLGPQSEAAGSAMSRVFNKMTQNIALSVADSGKAAKAVVDPLKVQAAQLKVEGAQIRLTKAIKDHGRASLEASIATNALAQAQNTLATAKAGKVAAGGDVIAKNAQARLDEFAKVTQMSVKDFTKLYKEDASGALELFLEKLGKMDKFAASAALRRAGIINVRDINAVLLLSQHTDVLNKNLTTSNKAWKDNTALMSVSEARFDTFKKHIVELKNTVLVAADAFGEGLLPAIGRVAAKSKTLLLAHLEDFRKMGLEVGAFIDGIQWDRVEGGLRTMADVARTVLDIVKQIAGQFPEATAGVVGLVGIDKLSGGLLGKGAGNIAGAGAGLLLNHFFDRGSSAANPVWVTGTGLGGGPAGPAGGAGGLLANILKFVPAIAAATIAYELGANVLGPQSDANHAQETALDKQTQQFTGGASLAEINASLSGIDGNIDRWNNNLTAEGIAFQLNIDGVRDAVLGQRAILQSQADYLARAQAEGWGVPQVTTSNLGGDTQDDQEKAMLARRGAFTSNPTRNELRNKIAIDKDALEHATGKNAKTIGADLTSLQNRLANRIDKANREAIAKAKETRAAIVAGAIKVADAVDTGWAGVAAAIEHRDAIARADGILAAAATRERDSSVAINPSNVVVNVAGRAIASALVVWDRSSRSRPG